MVKSDKSTKWFVRITQPWAVAKPLCLQLVSSIDVSGCVVGYHEGERTGKQHIHIALIMKNELQKQSVDKRLQTLYGVKGSGLYSSKIWDGKDEALSYLYHDDKGEVVFYNLPEYEAREVQYKKLHEEYHTIVIAAKKKASMKCVDSIIEEAKRYGKVFRTSEIVQKIYTGVRQGLWYPPVGQQLERYVTEVLIKQGDDEDGQKAIDYLVDRFIQRWR